MLKKILSIKSKNLSSKFEEQKNIEQVNEDILFEPRNCSTSSSSNLTESSELNDILSNESSKNLTKSEIQDSSLFQINISNDFISNLKKVGKSTRSSYYNKLLSKNIMNKPQKKFNNIFIFDWDDTLFCTSVLSPNVYFDEDIEISPTKIEKIEKMEKLVKNILLKSINKGDTYIISNSGLDWIYYSCQRFFPNLFELFEKVKVISARDVYEEIYPNEYKKWKIKSFNEIIKNYEVKLPTNLIIFGDSTEEVEAGYDLISKFPNGFLKIIKFREYPLISDLIKQLTLVTEKFEIFYSSCKNFTVNVGE